jgi:hypothetical protein
VRASSSAAAAPLACYLVGRAGLEPAAALELARTLLVPPESPPG